MSDILDARGTEPGAVQYSAATAVAGRQEGEVGVRGRGRSWLAAVVLIVALGLTVVVGSIVILGDLPTRWQPTRIGAGVENADVEALVLLFVAACFGFTGAVLALRRSDNPLLWIMAASGLLVAFSAPAATWDVPPGKAAATIGYLTSNGAFFTGLALFVCFFPMLFPDGAVPTRRWRWLVWIGVGAVVGTAAWAILVHTEGLGVGYWPFGHISGDSPVAALLGMGSVLVLASVLGGVAALAVRYRRGSAEMRKRIRLPMLAVAVWLPLFIVISVALERTEVGQNLGFLINLALPLLLVASMGVAITRYGLYDIDRIVARTVTYGIVVASLAAVFATGTIWLPQQLPTANSNLAVAASTLAVAALFDPLRRRVQRVVDRRFNRLPYDAERLSRDLVARLRTEVEPDEVISLFASATVDALQPTTAGTWTKGHA